MIIYTGMTTSVWINRRAKYEYNVEESKEAGVVLVGAEVKSIRQRGVDMTMAYAAFHGPELWVYKLPILQYRYSSEHQVPERPTKLLLRARELRKWLGASKRPGYTMIPMRAYLKGGQFKLEIALCTGKTKHDKRASEREKEVARNVREDS